MVGQSPKFKEAVGLARKVAERKLTTVLLTGETGTGKELFARGIHYSGPSRGEAFVALNCPAIPPALLESELFGHEKGAFTDAKSRKQGLLELAGEGTLFLDEVIELPPDLQPKLLRALEERRVRRLGGVEEIEVRCRIMAASNTSLETAVSEGRFRPDLFYRLNVFRIQIPPLRHRGQDIRLLANHFLQLLTQEQGLATSELTPGAIAAMERDPWPGNVRQMKNVIEQAAILAEGGKIREEHLQLQRPRDLVPEPTVDEGNSSIFIPPEGKRMEEIEAEALRITLEKTGGNQSAAARLLGLSRPTVVRKMKALGISSGRREGKG